MREPQKSYVPKKGDKDVYFDTYSSFTPDINNEYHNPRTDSRFAPSEACKKAMQEYAEKLLSSG